MASRPLHDGGHHHIHLGQGSHALQRCRAMQHLGSQALLAQSALQGIGSGCIGHHNIKGKKTTRLLKQAIHLTMTAEPPRGNAQDDGQPHPAC
jgi:hypothetical protein